MNFNTSLRQFLQAVAIKDRETLLTFFDKNVFHSAVLLDGTEHSSISSFMASQKEWFFSNEGNFEPTIVFQEEQNNIGYAIVDASLTQNEKTIDIRIIFVFKKYKNHWYFFYNQNTYMKKAVVDGL